MSEHATISPLFRCNVLLLTSFIKFNIPIPLVTGVCHCAHLDELILPAHQILSSIVVTTYSAAMCVLSTDASTADISLQFNVAFSIS